MSKRRSAATRPSADAPAWHFFGGKGGVGKTTCAAAWALAHAERGASVLVVSTDPAHSLGDAFARPLGRLPRRIPTRRGRLDAIEIDAARIVSRWLDEHRGALAAVIERGTLLDAKDVREMLALPIPGLDELAAFLQLAAFDARGKYELLVVDTAPTGHTLRLLETPETIDQLGRVLAAMDRRDAAVREALTGQRQAGARADIVLELHEHARVVASVLRDSSRCELWWITLPEPVTVAETVDALTWLRDRQLALKGIVVNRVTAQRRGRCGECSARRALERDALAPLAPVARGLELRIVPDHAREPRGPAALRAILPSVVATNFAQAKSVQPKFVATTSTTSSLADVHAKFVATTRRLLIFGGKGGVGKTTCAAAVALAAAREGRRVRLISIDPAPSLSAVLHGPIGDEWRPVGARLLARELDARRVLDEYKARYRQAVSDLFDRFRGGSVFDASADRAVFDQLFDLAPPGLDEIIALLTVTSLAKAGDRDTDLIVVDAAPTGHMLRLLAMPADAQRWVALLMRLMIKYQLTGKAESLASDLVTLARELRGLTDLLHDRTRAAVVAVTRPAMLPRLETSRLLKDLRRSKIPAPILIVNAETAGTCATCSARRRAETRELAELRRLCPRRTCVMVHAPLAIPPPRGGPALVAWIEQWTRDIIHVA